MPPATPSTELPRSIQRGFAEPPGGITLGSAAHREALALASPSYRGGWRRYRVRYLDRFRVLKLAYIASRRRFPLRLLNFLLFLLERGRRAYVHYFPVVVSIDPLSLCNLRCPGCTTGARVSDRRRAGRASLATLKAAIDRVYPWAIQLQLFHWGEPLLNPDTLRACAHAAKRGLWTSIHTNLSVRRPGLARDVCESGLCNLVVSCDGASQATYAKYRRGGDVELVFDNLRSISQERRRRGARLPWITAKFLVFDHNWHEMAAFRERVLAAGADEVMFVPGFSNGVYHTGRVASEVEFDVRTLRYVPRNLGKGCLQLWEGPSIDSDGGVYPCCDAYRDSDLFQSPDDFLGGTIMQLWNSERYLRARSVFVRGGTDLAAIPEPCRSCGRVAKACNREVNLGEQ